MSLDVYLQVNKCPHCGRSDDDAFWANITHNLAEMANNAGIYYHLWKPEEIGITTAHQLIEPLKKAIAILKADPDGFREFEPSNKWGTYDDFIPWLERYLKACEATPDATVRVSR